MANLDAAKARSDEIKVAASRSREMRVSFMLIVSMVFSRAKVSAFDLFGAIRKRSRGFYDSLFGPSGVW